MLRNPHLTSPKGRGKMLRNPHPCLRRSRVRQAASPCLRAGTGRPRGEVFALRRVYMDGQDEQDGYGLRVEWGEWGEGNG